MARLLHPFDGPGTRRPKNFLTEALRSLGVGETTGGPSSYSKVFFVTSPQLVFLGEGNKYYWPIFVDYLVCNPLRFLVTNHKI